MPALMLLSPHPLAGKTTVAAGLASRLAATGKTVALTRLGDDDHHDADSALLAALSRPSGDPANADVTLIETPAGDASPYLEADPAAGAVVVSTPATPSAQLADYCRPLAGRLAGVIINKVPSKRISVLTSDAEAAGLKVLAAVPEDRLLAAPVLRDVVEALSAQADHVDGAGLRPMDRPVIATISADPGQGYFARYDASAVIVRSDKPDLQLAALNAGASCLIVTGALPLLSYVLERAMQDHVPLLRTGLDTMAAVQGIEAAFGSLPFPGGDAKVERISALLANLDLALVLKAKG